MASYSANNTPLSGRTARISLLICSRDSSRSLRRMLDAYLDRSCRASLQSLPSKTGRPVPDVPCPHRRGLDLCMHTPVRRPGRCCAVSQQLPKSKPWASPYGKYLQVRWPTTFTVGYRTEGAADSSQPFFKEALRCACGNPHAHHHAVSCVRVGGLVVSSDPP
jgi:hypothetical protein